LLDGADDDGLDHIALLDVAARDRILDGGDDLVADAGVAPAGAAEHTDCEDLLRSGVVGDLESRLLLNHLFSPVVSPVLARTRGGRTGWAAAARPPPGPGSRRGGGGAGGGGGKSDAVTGGVRRSRRGASAWTRTADGSRPRRRGRRCRPCSPR